MLFMILFTVLLPQAARAHDPIFGVGPHVLHRRGWGWGVKGEYKSLRDGEEFKLEHKIAYGITRNWTVRLDTPWVRKRDHDRSSAGWGDSILRTKYRFWYEPAEEGFYQATLLGGLKLPTGDKNTRPLLGTGSVDYIGGLAVGYEGRRWFLSGSGRYKYNTEADMAVADDLQAGHQFFYDLALGYRPWRTGYWEPDVLVMGELSGEIQAHNRVDGARVPDTGGDTLYFGTGVWLTYRNFAVKPGIQIPVYESRRNGHNTNYKVLLDIHFHF